MSFWMIECRLPSVRPRKIFPSLGIGVVQGWPKLRLAKPNRFDPGNYEPSVARSLPLTAN